MDGFNENSNEQQVQQPMGCLHRFSKTIKVVIIGLLILLLMIPMFMIENLISCLLYTSPSPRDCS